MYNFIGFSVFRDHCDHPVVTVLHREGRDHHIIRGLPPYIGFSEQEIHRAQVAIITEADDELLVRFPQLADHCHDKMSKLFKKHQLEKAALYAVDRETQDAVDEMRRNRFIDKGEQILLCRNIKSGIHSLPMDTKAPKEEIESIARQSL